MLDQIIADKKKEVQQLMDAHYCYAETVHQRPIAHYPFADAIMQGQKPAIIAEVKKASPSKGIIRESFDPLEIARSYERANVAALSVLTDEKYFQGHLSYIAKIKEHVSLPVLRKDFIIDPIQIEQSVELGADAILLIARALDDQQLRELYEGAHRVGLDVLVEVADQEECENVLKRITPDVIGINNRDLRTFKTDPIVTEQLLPHIPKDIAVISESGIHSAETIRHLESLGVHGFLIGEYFMRQDDVQGAVEALVDHAK